MQATLRYGNPLMVSHTPSGDDVSAGDVVVIGAVPYVAHLDITDGELGSLAARGGVYRLIADGDYAPGAKVYWDDTANKITTAVGSHPHFGFIVPSSDPATDGDELDVEHTPDGSATADE